MTYYCATCKEGVERQICSACGQVAQPVEESGVGNTLAQEALSPLLRGPRREPLPELQPARRAVPSDSAAVESPEQPVYESAPATLSERANRHQQKPGAHSPSTGGRAAIGEAAQRQLRHFVDQEYEIFLVAGIYQVGKTQLMGAFEREGFLGALEDKKNGGRAVPTPPGELNCFAVEISGRKVAFVDAAGESFTHLYPYLRKGSEITEQDISFLKLLSDNLRGLVLLVDLQTLWHSELRKARDENSQQERILAWILELIRWLRLDGAYEPGALSFHQHVDSRVKTLGERLDVPVLALFTKADALRDQPVEGHASTDWMFGPEARNGRLLKPLGEQPLLLARHRLPILYGAVHAHARNFRFDFVHSVVADADSGTILEGQPSCGVDYSLGWLLDPAWRRRVGRPLPSQFWIGLQERLDKLTGRGERWRRLPDPEDFR